MLSDEVNDEWRWRMVTFFDGRYWVSASGYLHRGVIMCNGNSGATTASEVRGQNGTVESSCTSVGVDSRGLVASVDSAFKAYA